MHTVKWKAVACGAVPLYFPDKHTRKLDELPKYHKEPVWALFHYDMRDPLDHQALVEYIK